MPGHEFFERQLTRFTLQRSAARRTVDCQADAERLIATAEYECVQMRRELSAAFAVPLSHRAVTVEAVEAAAPAPDNAAPARAAKAA